LAFIVDSLNLKFKTCDLNKPFLCKYQAMAHYVELEAGNLKAARKDMENGLPFEEFVAKYPKAKQEKDLLVIKYYYQDYQGDDMVRYKSVLEDHDIRIEGNQKKYLEPVKGKWVIDYWNSGNYSDKAIRGFYFTTEFNSHPLPEKYARMVQYSECMVDTTSQIFKTGAERTTSRRFEPHQQGKVTEFMDYVHQETGKPEFEENNYEGYAEKYRVWDSLRVSFIDSVLSKTEKFQRLLKESIVEALEQGGSDDEFEEYVGKYYSRKAELELKRGRIVVGACSMDASPRIHAMNIAVLSAETVNWETFLRAHLDIMNDRFERVSDGNYAWAGRQTYIREIEELGLNVVDLLLGVSLRVENPSQNHYYGNIGRIGRALAETKYSKEVETKILEMIQDSQLDDFNRLLMYSLFLNYTHYLEDEDSKKQHIEILEAALQQLPDYLAARIQIDQ
jgi:hypothetical protein